jgi:hypothetical protein
MSDEQKMREAFVEWAKLGSDPYDVTQIGRGVFHSGNTQNAWYGWRASQAESAKEIERLKSDREAEMEGLWRVIEGQREDIERLKRVVDGCADALHKIATGRGHNSKGTHYYSCYDSLQSVARDALSAAEKECAK